MKREELERILTGDTPAPLRSELDALTERELEVFSILGQGYSPEQIQSEFGIDRLQLKQLKARILRKLKLKNEVELMKRAAKGA